MAISATETLNLCRRRSFRLCTTCRFSLSECEPSIRNSSVSTPIAAMSSSKYLGGHAFRSERFYDVTLLEIREIGQCDSALHAVFDFADVVFEPPQRTDFAGVHHHVVTQHPAFAVALYGAIRDLAPCHSAHLADTEGLANLGLAAVDFLEYRSKQARHGLFHLVRQIVNDGMQAHIHFF